ncbi:MAG: tetratricopeptide repeat protein [Spirochaetes bacterium]|nr:tetratricopeptide repeat protein [Spirochaetota bacterium]
MKRIIIFTFMLFFSMGLTEVYGAFAFKNNKGNKLYKKEKYKDALKKYMDAQIDEPESPILHYNMGNTYYKQKQYDKAVDEFTKSLTSNDKQVRAKAYYNLGNTHFQGRDYLKAIEYYKKTLEIDPTDEDAKYNIEISRKRLQQNMQNSDPNEDQDQQEQKQKKKQQDQSGNDNQKKDNNSKKRRNRNQQRKERWLKKMQSGCWML